MNFVIANTFTESLTKLAAPEQKRAKQAAFEFQIDPRAPGFRFHRVDGSRDVRFWSARVDADLRLIIHKDDDNFLLCYVGHHDDAYSWAERRKIAVHPRTGAAQIVILREVEEQVPIWPASPAAPKVQAIFSDQSDDLLLDFGVPQEWLDVVRSVDQEGLIGLIDKLPEEAMERLITLAAGEVPAATKEPTETPSNPFQHPDAQRRFRVLNDQEELRRALEFPWEKWLVFLHPDQKKIVERRYGGPARVSGSAGTGKTVVALHRVTHLVKANPAARILLSSYSKTLSRQIGQKLHLLLGPEVPRNVEVSNLHRLAYDQYLKLRGLKGVNIASDTYITNAIDEARRFCDCMDLSVSFLASEWTAIIESWSIQDWDAYRSVSRVGRGVQLGLKQKQRVWRIFEFVRHRLRDRKHVTFGDLFAEVGRAAEGRPERLFDHVIVDEAQDMGVAELRFVRAITRPGENDLFLAGDIGQRIFQPGASWKSLGIDVRGRSHRLRVNYRTSQQIRQFAEAILPDLLTDADGETEERKTISVFEGPHPTVRGASTAEEESAVIADWLRSLVKEGVQPGEIALFARSKTLLKRAERAAKAAGVEWRELTDDATEGGSVLALGTMHRAKGLEFKAVAVVGCDSGALPHPAALKTTADEAERQSIVEQEQHLLYVACTRARDRLLITYTGEPTVFLTASDPARTEPHFTKNRRQ
ncbi:3'-5' exonuclease [Azospirillum sp.]|uniref:3'-5' exonuclease n=1 Tax=Azospirillum sp. TaxID=34012 RepID=UPI002D5D3E4E|nr:3'-5' exonuclease [Azospirillum sp.]HYF86176.1 3'-5' exonuclease [Azospirillum sp.]